MKTLKELFLNELADIYDAEHRILKALPKISKAAQCEDLKRILMAHLKETEQHVVKVEQVFEAFDRKIKRKKCEATVGLLKEATEIAAEYKGSPALSAALISAVQKIEHYEIASYGCLHAWAGCLGDSEAVGLLEDILNEEKAANESLIQLALTRSNVEALADGSATRPVNGSKLKAEITTRALRPHIRSGSRAQTPVLQKV